MAKYEPKIPESNRLELDALVRLYCGDKTTVFDTWFPVLLLFCSLSCSYTWYPVLILPSTPVLILPWYPVLLILLSTHVLILPGPLSYYLPGTLS